MESPRNGLFIPLEVFKREYTSKLLLAAEMASRGMPVFIGHKSSVIRLAKSASQPGILFYKSAKGPGCEFFDELHDKGFVIVAQDEESGTVYDQFSRFYESRLSLRTAGDLNQFFCWGKDDFHHITQHTNGNAEVIKLTGSPRTCFWGEHGRKYFREEIDQIRKKYGPFIFVASNFSSGNCYLSPEETIAQLSQHPLWNEEEKNKHLERVEFDNRMIATIIKAAKTITKWTQEKIIIRPHPSENIETWRQLTEGMSNVFIESDGDMTPWILAAKCVVQNGCTSALEAVSAGVPTIAFGEYEEDLFGRDNSIPNQCAIPAIGVDNLMEVLANLGQRWDENSERRRLILDRKVHNAGTLQPVYDITECLFSLSGPPNPRGNADLGGDTLLYDLFELYRMSKFRKQNRSTTMDQTKRPTLRLSKVKNDLRRIISLLNYDDVLDVVRVAPSCFRITKRMDNR